MYKIIKNNNSTIIQQYIFTPKKKIQQYIYKIIKNNNNTTVQKYNIRNRPKNRNRLDISTEKNLERKYIDTK